MEKIINKSKIAILLGVYNGDLYIKEQIDSILNQSYENWTLYLRDDDSTDNTREILNEYERKFTNIVIITDNDGNLGCNGNYYRLLSIVESEYYMFCNADDYWFSDKIKITFERMLSEESINNNEAIIIHTDLSITDMDLNVTEKSYWVSTNTNPEKFKTYNKLGVCCIVAGATMLFNYRTKEITFPVLSKLPFFDQWIAFQVAQNGRIITIHKPTMAYRQIGTNLAAVTVGVENSLLYKIIGIKSVLKSNIREFKMLKEIGWGSFLKYFYFRTKVFIMIRFGSSYKNERKKIVRNE